MTRKNISNNNIRLQEQLNEGQIATFVNIFKKIVSRKSKGNKSVLYNDSSVCFAFSNQLDKPFFILPLNINNFIDLKYYPFKNKEQTLNKLINEDFADVSHPDLFVFNKNNPKEPPFASILLINYFKETINNASKSLYKETKEILKNSKLDSIQTDLNKIASLFEKYYCQIAKIWNLKEYYSIYFENIYFKYSGQKVSFEFFERKFVQEFILDWLTEIKKANWQAKQFQYWNDVCNSNFYKLKEFGSWKKDFSRILKNVRYYILRVLDIYLGNIEERFNLLIYSLISTKRFISYYKEVYNAMITNYKEELKYKVLSAKSLKDLKEIANLHETINKNIEDKKVSTRNKIADYDIISNEAFNKILAEQVLKSSNASIERPTNLYLKELNLKTILQIKNEPSLSLLPSNPWLANLNKQDLFNPLDDVFLHYIGNDLQQKDFCYKIHLENENLQEDDVYALKDVVALNKKYLQVYYDNFEFALLSNLCMLSFADSCQAVASFKHLLEHNEKVLDNKYKLKEKADYGVTNKTNKQFKR